MKLTEEQIKIISNLKTINEKKDYLQDEIAIPLWKAHPMGLFRHFTGSGKGTLIAKLIKSLNTNYPHFTFAVVVPTQHLYDELKKDIEDFDLKNVEPFIINTYTARIKKGWKPKYNVLITDEAHIGSNESSLVFSNAVPLTDFEYFLGVSATFEKEHLEYFAKLGIPLLSDITIEDGYRCGMVPSYSIYNIPVELTEKEKREYVKYQDDYSSMVEYFSKWEPYNPYGAMGACLTPKGKAVRFKGIVANGEHHAQLAAKVLNSDAGKVIGNAKKGWLAVQARTKLIDHAENSILRTIELLKRLNGQTIVFTANTEIADRIYMADEDSVNYHYKVSSSKKKNNLESFISGKKEHIITCKSLDVGFNLNSVKYGIQQSYRSKVGKFSQRNGRMARFDPEDIQKEVIMFNFYIDDFTYDNKLIESQQKKWLINSLRGANFVAWINSINEVILE